MRVLLIAEDPAFANSLQQALEARGLAVDRQVRWATALDWLRPGEYAAALLDTEADERIGAAVHRLRERDASLAIILLSTDAALDAQRIGADGHVLKPPDIDGLVGRLRAIRRRRAEPAAAEIVVGNVRLSPVRARVHRGARNISLSSVEYTLLAVLMTAPGQCLTRAQLAEHVYGEGKRGSDRRIQVLVHHLRRKLGAGLIRNVRGRGYFFDPQG